jgi:TetR/AcrR family transcriptional regulator, transcriptional repressor for nem operon
MACLHWRDKKFKKNLHIPTGRYIFVATNMDTRTQILQHIFEAIKLHGYQGLRTDKVIAALGVTKGAFYHYFPDKQSVGYAVTDEIIAPMYIGNWSNLLTGNGSVLENLLAGIQRQTCYVTDGNVHLGCPLNNLIQEMSPLDEGFRLRLRSIVERERALIEAAIKFSMDAGELKPDVDPNSLSLFILSAIEGSYSIAKSLQRKSVFDDGVVHLKAYLLSLKQ